jgi:ACS family hexuronate transporter-like MFS transporter
MVSRFLTDPVWWFYLYWAPKFLYARHGVTLDQIGPPLVMVYLAADGGSVFGGWLSGAFLKRGWSVNAARKVAILVSATMVAPIVFAPWASHLWQVVLLLGLATAGHQAWGANIFTIVSDLYPGQAVSSVVGISGFAGSAGGMLAATATGFVLQTTGSYVPVFACASCAYFLALLAVHAGSPKLAMVKV